jgi:hypothetical protein
MKNNIILALIVFTIGAQVAFGHGGKEGGGGDTCQDRVETIRNDISDWIQGGGAAGLKLPAGVTLDTYKQRMLKEIALTRTDGQHSIVCKKNPKDVVVGTSEKICASSSPSKPKIVCYREGFMHLSEDDQYFMVHHEFAFLSGFEDQDGAQSDYPLSDQITKYLQEETVKKLAVKPSSNGNGMITVTSVTSSLDSLSNSFGNNYYYPAFTSMSYPESPGPVVGKLGVIDVANGFNFVDLAADSNPNAGIGSENPGIVYFNVSLSNVNFAQPVALAVYAENPLTNWNELLPIASYNQTMCGNGDGGNCLIPELGGGLFGNNYFYALNYVPGQSVTVGLDIQAICRSSRTTSGFALPFCNTHLLGNSNTPTSGTPLAVNFAIFNQTDLVNLGSFGGVPPLPTAQVGPIQVALNFVSLAEDSNFRDPNKPLPLTPMRAALCNLTATSLATPVDSGIEIDGTQFGISSGLTGPGAIIAVANLGTTVNDQAQNYMNGNSIIGYFAPGTRFVLGGFQNSTPTQSFKYKIGFLVRDYAGFVFDDQSGGDAESCTLPGEYTVSEIQGHLNSKK